MYVTEIILLKHERRSPNKFDACEMEGGCVHTLRATSFALNLQLSQVALEPCDNEYSTFVMTWNLYSFVLLFVKPLSHGKEVVVLVNCNSILEGHN